MTARCIYETDETGRCLCQSHARTGPAAKLFGTHPACVLIGSPASVSCLDREAQAEQTGHSGTIWDRLADVDLEKFVKDVEGG